MRFTVSHLALIGSWLLISIPATSQDYARNGFYAGASVLGGTYTKIEDELEDALPGADIDVDTGIAFDVYAGYRLHPNFAIEAEFEMIPEVDVDLGGFGTFAELESWTLTGNMKVFVLTGRAQPFVKVGFGAIRAEVDDTVGLGISESDSGFASRFGGGLDFYITENIVASAGVDYLLPAGDVEDLEYVSYGGGIQYRF